MKIVTVLSLMLLLATSVSHGAVVSYRAEGSVASFQGDTSLLPVISSAGDSIQIDFTFDTSTLDTQVSTNQGKYAVTEFVLTVGNNAPLTATEATITIQYNPFSSIGLDVWGITGCIPQCNGDLDHARLNFFLPGDTYSSDALVLPPTPSEAVSIQFGLFSRDQVTGTTGFLIANLTALTQVIVDEDGDGVPDGDDLCPGTLSGPVDATGCSDVQVDVDGDGWCDIDAPSSGPSSCVGVDNCPIEPNPDQTDSNGDGFGDACVDPTVIIPGKADVDPSATIGADSAVDQGVVVEAGVEIGSGTSLKRNSTVGQNTVIGNNVAINQGVFIGADVTIGDNVTIARNATIEDGVQIGDGVVIEQGAFIGAGAVIGNNVVIGKDAIISPGSIIPDGTVVSKNATFGTVNYDEQRDGDIEGAYGLGPVFELGLGVNTVAGIGNGPDSGDDLFDFDVFSIVIPNGRSLTSISLDNWGTPEQKSIFMRIRPCAQPTSCSFQWSVVGGFDFITGQQATDASIAADVAAIPLNFSEYTFNNSGQLVDPGVPYVWTFFVE